jgi:hypothetical protein
MKNKRFILILIAAWITAIAAAPAATIPSGTTLAVRTIGAISSHARQGGTFQAALDRDVVVNGQVVLSAGTPCSGVIEASRASRSSTSSSPLSLDLTGISVQGQSVPVKTTGGVQPNVRAKTTRQARGGSSAGETTFAPGTKMEFRLAQPLNF